ncbi:putative chromosome segregation protein [Diaporthe ampelina]|uniref:Putative chromosome segregation protein n=1 Tax=Diaporthe ampelina TaxID=1214573 RepID=A0A0G2FU51_9PEZI|nr:putative chromosome segregation protein [Diaporthe ampelina]
MPRVKQSTLLDLADSDSDSGFNTQSRAPNTTDDMPAAKKGRGRAPANKVAKPEPKTKTRRVGAKAAAALEEEAERQALAEKATNQPAKATRGRKAKKAAENEDEDDADDVLATPPHSDEPAKTKGGRGRPRKNAVVPDSVQKKSEPSAVKRGRKAAADKTGQQATAEIPETQLDGGMDIDAAEEQDQVEDLPTFSRFSAPPSAQRLSSYQIPLSASKRSASSSLIESDPSTRRHLGDLTKKYEALELRYRELRNVAVVEAEKNFDQLKKQSDEKTQASNELITSLKSDLAAQRQLAKEGQKSQQQFEASQAKADKLQAQITEITTTLSEAKTEIKSLTTKLNAARAAEATATATAQAASVRVPGSAMKPSAMGGRGVDQAQVQAQVQATHTAKMKENLYSDLTGLVVTGIKRDGPEDVYDCIQTGRNGTLHFKLAIANENSDENTDEAEFMYKPQLDERRDSQLIEMLPEYLVEEISFPRAHAAKFYSRVLKSLTERLE